MWMDDRSPMMCGEKSLHYQGMRVTPNHYIPYCDSINHNGDCISGERTLVSKLKHILRINER